MLIAFGASAPQASARDLQLGKLDTYKQCVDASLENDLAEENQRYWFPRKPPYIGFSKGEQTTAGGDGTCYLGFPSAKKSSAILLIENAIVEVLPVGKVNAKMLRFQSRDRKTQVAVRITGTDSTCTGDSCCGTYQYATITVTHQGKVARVRAANYQGA